jgi:hypothetical protein
MLQNISGNVVTGNLGKIHRDFPNLGIFKITMSIPKIGESDQMLITTIFAYIKAFTVGSTIESFHSIIEPNH